MLKQSHYRRHTRELWYNRKCDLCP